MLITDNLTFFLHEGFWEIWFGKGLSYIRTDGRTCIDGGKNSIYLPQGEIYNSVRKILQNTVPLSDQCLPMCTLHIHMLDATLISVLYRHIYHLYVNTVLWEEKTGLDCPKWLRIRGYSQPTLSILGSFILPSLNLIKFSYKLYKTYQPSSPPAPFGVKIYSNYWVCILFNMSSVGLFRNIMTFHNCYHIV